jgi:lysine-specific demethylase 8
MIERVHAPSAHTFQRDFVRANRPVVITGIAGEWPALKRWTPDYLAATFPEASVVFTSWESDNPKNDPRDYYEKRRKHRTQLSNFVASINTGQDFSRNYITQFPLFREMPQLKEDIGSLDDLMNVSHPLSQRFKKHPTMWLGPAHTVTPIHFDGADNLLVQIYGRKKLTLIPPAQSDCLYYPCLRLGHVHYSPVDIEEPDYDQFPKYRDATPTEVTLEPGDILFIPVRWWHHARSLDTSISLNFWWFSLRSLFRMRHPYFVYQKHRLMKKMLSSSRRKSESRAETKET